MALPGAQPKTLVRVASKVEPAVRTLNVDHIIESALVLGEEPEPERTLEPEHPRCVALAGLTGSAGAVR